MEKERDDLAQPLLNNVSNLSQLISPRVCILILLPTLFFFQICSNLSFIGIKSIESEASATFRVLARCKQKVSQKCGENLQVQLLYIFTTKFVKSVQKNGECVLFNNIFYVNHQVNIYFRWKECHGSSFSICHRSKYD